MAKLRAKMAKGGTVKVTVNKTKLSMGVLTFQRIALPSAEPEKASRPSGP